MSENKGCSTILMADDDPDDRLIVTQAFLEIRGEWDLRFVEDGEELMHYLRRTGNYADSLPAPVPGFILLDLNMPKKDGRQAVAEIKADPDLREIPVVIWTTSKELRDRVQCDEAGAECYITKPGDYTELINALRDLISRFCSG